MSIIPEKRLKAADDADGDGKVPIGELLGG